MKMDGDGKSYAGELTKGGVTWQVEIDTRSHLFEATAPGFRTMHGHSWAELENVVKVTVSKARTQVAVPFAYLKGTLKEASGGQQYYEYAVRTGTATGIHAGTGKVLYTGSDGNKGQQLNAYSQNEFRVPPDAQAAAGLADMATAISRMEAELSALRAGLAFSHGTLKGEVEHAIKEARVREAKEEGNDHGQAQ